MVILGAHLSIAGGLHRAIETAKSYQCNALQIFTKNSNTWKERFLSDEEVEKFRGARENCHIIEIAAHTSYLINLASFDDHIWFRSRAALKQEFLRCFSLQIRLVVLHPGAHKGKGERKGIERIVSAINHVFEETADFNGCLLLETTAGQGSHLGYRFEQLAAISEKIEQKHRIGYCLDTCHIFAAGYDIRTEEGYEKTMGEFARILGLENLRLIHLNDSKKDLGSRIDRHEHIGEGQIGKNAFYYIMNDVRLAKVPKIIETPKIKNGVEQDPVNLRKLKNMVGQQLFKVSAM